MRRSVRIALWILAPFLIIALAVAGAFVWLRSASGVAYVVRTIESVASMPGMDVKIVGLEGSLPFQARIAEIRVSDRDGSWLTVSNVSLDIASGALFSRRLLIRELTAGEVALSRLPISETPPPKTDDGLPLQLPDIDLPRLPLAVALDRLAVDRIVLGADVAGTPAELKLAGTARIDGDGANVSLDLNRMDLPGAATVRATASGDPLVLALHVTADEPGGAPLAKLLGHDEPMPTHVELHGEGPLAAWRGRLEARGGPATMHADITFDQTDRWRAGMRLVVEPGALIAPEMTGIVGPRPEFAISVAPLAPKGLEIVEIRLDTPGLRMNGAGVLAPDRLDFGASLAIDDLAPFGELAGQPLAGKATAALKLGGTEARPVLTATVDAADLRAAEAVIGRLQAKFDGQADVDPGAKLRRATATVEARAERIQAPGLRGPTERAELSLAGETSGDLQTAILNKLSLRLPGIALDASGRKDQSAIKGTLRVVAEDIGKTLAMVMDPAAGLTPQGALTVEGDINGPLDRAELALRASSPSIRTGIAQADTLLARGLKLDGKARWNGETLTIQGLDLALAEAKAALSGSVTPQTQRMAIDFDTALSRLGAVVDGMQGTVGLKGKLAGTFAAPTLNARLAGAGIVSGGIRVDQLTADIESANLMKPDARLALRATAGKLEAALSLAVAQERDGMRIRDLLLEGAGARIAGDGVLTPKGQFVGRVQGKIPDLAPWSALAGQQLTGSLDLEARATAGRGQNVDIDLSAQSIALGADAAAPKVGRARIVGRLQNLPDRPDGQLDVTIDQLSAGAAKLATLKLGLRPAGTDRLGFTLATNGSIPAPITLQAAGTLALAAPRRSLELTRLDGTVAGERLAMRQPLRATESGDAWVVAPFNLAVGSGTVGGSGRYDPRRVEAALTVRKITLAFLSRLGDLTPLLGTLDVDAKVGGPLNRPTGTVSVAVADAGFAQASPVAGRRISGKVDATLAANETRLQGSLTAGGGTNLGLGGTVPVTLDLTGSGVVIDQARPLRVKVTGNADLGALADVIPLGEDRLTGKLAVDVDVGGTIAKPVPRGTATLSDARYVNQISGMILDRLQVGVTVNGDIITVSQLAANDGERGHLSGSGRIDLSRKPMPDIDIGITIENFRIARRDDARVLAQGNLRVVNSAEKAAATGQITVTNAELRFPERLPPSIVVLDVTEIDSRKTGRRAPERPKVPPAAANALALDITISLPRAIYVRGRGLDSEWNGRMHIGGTSARPIIDGNLGIVRGTLDLLGRDFRLARGSLTFDGIPEINPRIDIMAQTTTGGITAQVEIGGTPRAPKLTLTSTPPLPQDEVLARILFDKNIGSITPIQGLQLAAAARELAGGGGGFDVFDKLRGATGLSRLSINGPTDSSAGLAGTTVSGGRYIGNGVYVGVDQGTTGASTKAKVEIELTPRITVDSTLGATGQGIGLNYKFDY